MAVVRWAVACGVLLSGSSSALGFEFDVFVSGQRLDDVMVTAQEFNRPLVASTVVAEPSGFDYDLALRDWGEAKDYKYNRVVYGRPATVILSFTPTSWRLHTVQVRWKAASANDRDTLADRFSMLMRERYGPSRTMAPKEVFWRVFLGKNDEVFRIGKEDYVILQRCACAAVHAYFVNETMGRLNETEIERERLEQARRRNRPR